MTEQRDVNSGARGLLRMITRRTGLVCAWIATVAAITVVGLIPMACQPRDRGEVRVERSDQPEPPPVPARPAAREPAPIAVEPASGPQEPGLPTLDGEPEILVLLDRGPTHRVELLQAARTASGARIPAGVHRVVQRGDRVAIGEVTGPAGGALRLDFAQAGPRFALAEPDRRFAGDLVLAVSDTGKGVLVLEAAPIELYLIGVLTKEVEPDWPLEALKAQAVAARSYATAGWMTNHRRGWHMDASEQVDMAYAGHVERPHRNLVVALAQTRGNLLWFADQPLPAYFHASSGGHTEDMAVVWPRRTMPDGTTSPAPAMPPNPDPWDKPGRAVAPKRLGAWRADLPLDHIQAKLVLAGHRQVGRITSMRLTARDRESERARRLRISWAGGHLDVEAHDFRMAMGSTIVKSTLWRDFRIAGDLLVIQGHGYGHGIGLPQASAWAMARAGHLAPAILGQYYPGAGLVRKW